MSQHFASGDKFGDAVYPLVFGFPLTPPPLHYPRAVALRGTSCYVRTCADQDHETGGSRRDEVAGRAVTQPCPSARLKPGATGMRSSTLVNSRPGGAHPSSDARGALVGPPTPREDCPTHPRRSSPPLALADLAQKHCAKAIASSRAEEASGEGAIGPSAAHGHRGRAMGSVSREVWFVQHPMPVGAVLRSERQTGQR